MKLLDYFNTETKLNQIITDRLSRLPDDCLTDRVLLAWERGDLLTPGWNPDGTLIRSWRNVVAHQMTVAVVADHLSAGLLLDEQRRMLVEAALVHDSFKRREQGLRDEAGLKDSLETERQAEIESEHLLLALGFSKATAQLSSQTGHRGLECVRTSQASLMAKILFYADCTVSNYDIVGHAKRLDDVLPEFQPAGRYAGLQEAYLKRYGKTHREVWDEVLASLEEDLSYHLGFGTDREQLHSFLREAIPDS